MSLMQDPHDSLPYIDPDVHPQNRTQIFNLLDAELPKDYATNLHPLMLEIPSSIFSPIITAELERIASKQPLVAIDTTRYEALEPPLATEPVSDEERAKLLEAWNVTLQRAYASVTHLDIRSQNLALLEQFGRNAWLIGNSQLEEILKRMEKELVATTQQLEETMRIRKREQEDVSGEMTGLDEGWRKGIGKIVEVEVAAERLRREILERRRDGAV